MTFQLLGISNSMTYQLLGIPNSMNFQLLDIPNHVIYQLLKMPVFTLNLFCQLGRLFNSSKHPCFHTKINKFYPLYTEDYVLSFFFLTFITYT